MNTSELTRWMYERIPELARMRDEALRDGRMEGPFSVNLFWRDYNGTGRSAIMLYEWWGRTDLLDRPVYRLDGTLLGTIVEERSGLYLLDEGVPDTSLLDVQLSLNPPMRQFTSLLANGLGKALEEIEGFLERVDVELCPVELLPELGNMLGFDFPYDLPEDQQRSFVRSAVTLYRVKGTPHALKMVVTRFIGADFSLELLEENRLAKTFKVQLTANEQNVVLNALEQKVAYLIALYSPAGMIPALAVVYYASDELDSTRQNDDVSYDFQLTSWRVNLGHRVSKNARVNRYARVYVGQGTPPAYNPVWDPVTGGSFMP